MTEEPVYPTVRPVLYAPGFRAILVMAGTEIWACEHVHKDEETAHRCAHRAMDEWSVKRVTDGR